VHRVGSYYTDIRITMHGQQTFKFRAFS